MSPDRRTAPRHREPPPTRSSTTQAPITTTIAQDGDSAVAPECEITVGKATAVYARLLGEAVS